MWEGGAAVLSRAMAEALSGDLGLLAVAWVDLRTGAVLQASARDDDARDALDVVALAARQLCTAPRLDALPGDEVDAREALVVSDLAVHAFALAPRCKDRVVVGVALAGVNVGLLLASLRSLAEVAAP